MEKRTGWMFRLLASVFVLACLIASYWIIIPLVAPLFGVELRHAG